MEEEILNLLKKNTSGLTAREISEKLNIHIKDVNSLIYGELKDKCVQDNKYCWYLKEKYSSKTKKAKTIKDTKLAKLSQYYLSCLSNSELEIKADAKNSDGNEIYVELKNLELNSNDISDFYSKTKRDKGKHKIYLGYPTNLKKAKPRGNNLKGFLVEPIFLIPIEKEDEVFNAQYSNLIINFGPLKRYTNANQEQLMEELLQLEEELGLSDNENILELEEVSRRLKSIRSEWLWQEDVNLEKISYDTLLKDLNKEGIYNRAICITYAGSSFTQGLEAELKELSQLEEVEYKQSILGKWIDGYKENDNYEEVPLLEVLPMNLEQSQAIKLALTNNLTVITGPPGTGKSQIVTNLLVNAVWHGKRVLFASKNNKAVDVVENRANNLGTYSFLLRKGSFRYSSKFLEHLINLLSTKTTPEDEDDYNFYQNEYNELKDKLDRLKRDEENFIKLRNELDNLSKDIEIIRKNVDISKLRGINLEQLKEKYGLSKSLFGNCIKNNHNSIIHLIWDFLKKKYYNAFLLEIKTLIPLTDGLPLKKVNLSINGSLIKEWEEFFKELSVLIGYANKAHKYFSALEELNKAKSLESIAVKRFSLMRDMSKYANNLWEKWLKMQSKTLSSEDRKEVSQYDNLFKMIKNNQRYDKDLYKRYMEISKKTSHLFPALAITSLSAKGKIPLEENFFDIVIFDEASQCDIASALPLLYRAKSAVIIGDVKQLSHISNLKLNQDTSLLKKYDLLKDFLHWAYSNNSLFQLACSFINPNNNVKLKDHHRSHKDIINFSNKHFYEEELRIATNYNKLKPPTPKDIGIRWENVLGKAIKPNMGGAENLIEAKAVVEEIRKLINKNYTGSIGVVTPFRSQANLIRRLVNRENTLSHQLMKNDFLVDTVHKFQGDEKDIMIFSPVISQGISKGSLNFMK